VKQRWETWQAAAKLESVFQTKRLNIKAIIEVAGSNEYKIPRSGRSHAGEKRASFTPLLREKRDSSQEDSEEQESEDSMDSS